MAEESKFLKYQDKDGNKVPDVCPDIPFVPEPKKCPECVPNEGYIAPAWRDQNVDSPWFDEKNVVILLPLLRKKRVLFRVAPLAILIGMLRKQKKNTWKRFINRTKMKLLLRGCWFMRKKTALNHEI